MAWEAEGKRKGNGREPETDSEIGMPSKYDDELRGLLFSCSLEWRVNEKTFG